jgi:2-hydroxy-3-keto-5-methylthiopentenyl-1-phosphate phosphatase
MTTTTPKKPTRYLVASDFDQTLSFNDSGRVLADILGIGNFEEKVHGLASAHLVQQGAELAYLLRHDPAFRSVRREHLVEAGKRVRLKNDVKLLANILGEEIDGNTFQFVVISAAPREVVQSALEGIVPAENVHGKVAVLQELEHRFETSPNNTIYIGDGSSDLYVMHHVNSRDGLTIAVSESKDIGRIAKRTVLSDNATSVLAPMLEDALKWDAHQIRALYEQHGLSVQGWDKVRTDWLTFHHAAQVPEALAA